jgi:dTDP-4-dehydrorhamnose reductase
MRTRRLVLIFGAAGQLGEAMSERLASHHEVVTRTRDDVDIADAEAVRTAIVSICPDAIVNCAAYTDVDGAEHDPVTALAANAWGVRTLARLATQIDATLVHFSTDFVFDGSSDRPYTEDDAPNPRGIYAVSKLLGEWFAQETPKHYVLRVESLFGGPRAKSSIDRLLDGIVHHREVRAFVDRTVSPSYVADVAMTTETLLEGGHPYGLYHCVNGGWTTWSQLARELARITGHPDASITDVRMSEAGLVAQRPQFAALDNGKLAQAGILLPTWQDALARHVQALAQP